VRRASGWVVGSSADLHCEVLLCAGSRAGAGGFSVGAGGLQPDSKPAYPVDRHLREAPGHHGFSAPGGCWPPQAGTEQVNTVTKEELGKGG
jgi:hypothetical protein